MRKLLKIIPKKWKIVALVVVDLILLIGLSVYFLGRFSNRIRYAGRQNQDRYSSAPALTISTPTAVSTPTPWTLYTDSLYQDNPRYSISFPPGWNMHKNCGSNSVSFSESNRVQENCSYGDFVQAQYPQIMVFYDNKKWSGYGNEKIVASSSGKVNDYFFERYLIGNGSYGDNLVVDVVVKNISDSEYVRISANNKVRLELDQVINSFKFQDNIPLSGKFTVYRLIIKFIDDPTKWNEYLSKLVLKTLSVPGQVKLPLKYPTSIDPYKNKSEISFLTFLDDKYKIYVDKTFKSDHLSISVEKADSSLLPYLKSNKFCYTDSDCQIRNSFCTYGSFNKYEEYFDVWGCGPPMDETSGQYFEVPDEKMGCTNIHVTYSGSSCVNNTCKPTGRKLACEK